MASKILSLFFSLLLLIVSADGRSLQKNYTSENVDFSHGFSFATTYTGKTNYSDALGLVALITNFPLLEEDNVDPCLPPRWSWIECNSDAKPRVIALNLRNKLLVGVLPDFSTMDALQRIDFSHNALYGSIPSFLGKLPALQELNLAYNLFSGLVPDSIACSKNLETDVTGNSGLYVSDRCSTSNNNPTPTADTNSDGSFYVPATRYSKKKSSLPAILGSTISVFSVIWIVVGVYAIFRHKSKTAAAIAEAAAQGPSETKDNTPVEEMPINSRPNYVSP